MASPGNLCRLTEDLIKRGQQLPTLGIRILILSGEILTPQRRAYLSKAWDAKVISLYGSAETDSLGIECQAELGHHVWADQFFIEVEGWGPVTPGQGPVIGNLIITTLARRAMPLLRYRLGDTVRADWLPCSCGITHPRIEVLGRCDGSIILAEGTALHSDQIKSAVDSSLIPVLGVQGVLQYSEDKEQLVVRLAPSRCLSEEEVHKVEAVISRLSIDFADAVEAGALSKPLIEVVSLTDLYRTPRGKILPLVDRRLSRTASHPTDYTTNYSGGINGR